MDGLMTGRYLERFAWLSVATGIVVLALKTWAWQITGSVGLLSDALESTVNIGAALVAVFALRAANRPADAEHHFGHGKAEYLSAMVEGFLILAASAAIIASAVNRLLSPEPLEQVGVGLLISVLASCLNGAVAFILLRVGRAHRSMVLIADGKHLLTDVWTSAGVVVGVGAVALTGWVRLDPIIALLVGANILWTGWGLLRESVSGLLDERLSDADIAQVVSVLAAHESPQVHFHALQSRAAGRQRFVSLHMLVPGVTSVRDAHDRAQQIEDEIDELLPGTVVSIHIEPLEDPRAWDDIPRGAEHPLNPSETRFGDGPVPG
jgi:cation diffusion facilitator family transporter